MQWLLDHIVCYFQTALTLAANAIIAALGAFIAFIAGLLPEMPGYPPVPELVETAMQWAYYVVDVGWLLAYIVTFFALMGTVFLLMIPLRWIKAVDN